MYATRTHRLTTTYALPVDLEKLKLHLKVEGTEEDAYITDLACAAGALWEERVSQAVMQAEYVSVNVGYAARIDGLRRPTTAISKVEIVGEDNAVASLPAVAYQLADFRPDTVYFPAHRSLPPLSRTAADAVRVYYTAGAATVDEVPALIRQFIYLVVGHWYENRQEVIPGVNGVQQIPLGAQALIDLEREPVL